MKCQRWIQTDFTYDNLLPIRMVGVGMLSSKFLLVVEVVVVLILLVTVVVKCAWK